MNNILCPTIGSLSPSYCSLLNATWYQKQPSRAVPVRACLICASISSRKAVTQLPSSPGVNNDLGPALCLRLPPSFILQLHSKITG